MAPPARRIGVLAGGGTLPVEFARSASARGELAMIVAIEGFADGDFGSLPVTRVGMGEIGRLIRTFRTAGATDIVIIGPARRPDLRRIRPDLGFFRNLPELLRILSSGGDDGVLSGVVRFFERKGFRVIGPGDVAPETLAAQGVLTTRAPNAGTQADIALGLSAIRLLGDLDVGQAVIVSKGGIEAIEGAEGTDGMLARVRGARQRSGAPARQGVLVKRSKPGQELRVDMPSIGPGTVAAAAAAGLEGIAVEAEHVLVAGREEVLRRAEEAGIFIAGVEDHDPQRQEQRGSGSAGPVPRYRLIGRRSMSERGSRDLERAAAVMARLAPYECGSAVAVARGYVLAVEAGGEGAAAVVERSGAARLRGRSRPPKPAGLVLLSHRSAIDASLVAGISCGRFAGIALCGNAAGAVTAGVMDACDRNGLYILAVDDPGNRA